MKKIILLTLVTLLVGCEQIETPNLEKHEVTLECVIGKRITLHDEALGASVLIEYSYELFQCELLLITRAYCNGKHPVFVFLCDVNTKTYYRL